jgi:signal transduction histidine kinase
MALGQKTTRPRKAPLRNSTMAELSAALVQAERTIEKLRARVDEREQSRQTLEKLTLDLAERVKELNCLYSISSIFEQQGSSLDEILQRTAELIPAAWQYPDITCSRIALDDRACATSGFRETPWGQSQPIIVNNSRVGSLDIYYTEERPERDEGPFLREERNLLNALADRIGDIIERKRAEKALQESEAQNRALLNAIPDLMFRLDADGILLGLHEGSMAGIKPFSRELVGRHIYVLSDEKQIVPKRILEQGMVYVKQALETGRTQFFEQHLSLNGTGRDFEVRIGVSRENEVLGIVRDITVRKRLEREILEISGREQRRIGQDLHDSLCQHLAGVGFLCKVLEKKLAAAHPAGSTDAAEIVDLIDQAITLTRGFARGLNPVRLEAEGLMFALSELASNAEKLFGIRCRFECEEPLLIDDSSTSTNLYRIVQEALNNSIKHGKADSVQIRFTTDGRMNTLTVADNGLGFIKTPGHAKGMGMNIMSYRASMIGATLDIRGNESGGTVLTCSFQSRNS